MTIPRQIWLMMLVAILGSFASRLVMSYIPIYALTEDYLNLGATEYGFIQTVGAIPTTVMSMPGGLLADRVGRKPLIMISRITTPISLGLIPFAYNYPTYFGARILNNIGASFGGGGRGTAGGPAWNAMIMDMVPIEKRGTVMGTIGTLTGIVGIPAPILGSYLWETFSPMVAFQTSVAFGLVGAFVFLLFVKEHKGEPLDFGNSDPPDTGKVKSGD